MTEHKSMETKDLLYLGTVKFYTERRAFGFLLSMAYSKDGGNTFVKVDTPVETFVHVSSVEPDIDNFKYLQAGETCMYTVDTEAASGRTKCTNVTGPWGRKLLCFQRKMY